VTTRKCSAVNGCSYMSVFIAGKMYVGVVGASALRSEVWWMDEQGESSSFHTSLPQGYHTNHGRSSTGYLRNKVQPALYLPISGALCGELGHLFCRNPFFLVIDALGYHRRFECAYRPFILIGPYPRPSFDNIIDRKESE
jgi:hypothetical protein